MTAKDMIIHICETNTHTRYTGVAFQMLHIAYYIACKEGVIL